MAYARVVSFEGVSKDRMEEMQREMDQGQPPEGFPPAEVVALHDADAERSLVIFIFEMEDDSRRAAGADLHGCTRPLRSRRRSP